AHRAGVLLDGALVQVDTPMHLFAAPANLAIAAFLEIPNRWTRQEAAVLLSDLPVTATHVVLPASAVRAVADPSGSARVERLLPSRERLRVTLRLGEVAVIAEVVGAPLHPGDRVTLEADADRATCFDGGGRRITPAVSNR